MNKLEIYELGQFEQSFNKIPAFNEYSFSTANWKDRSGTSDLT